MSAPSLVRIELRLVAASHDGRILLLEVTRITSVEEDDQPLQQAQQTN
ncbi:hypothetical protein Pyrfu_0427 [Pyrolobus fumarii 1A]|uniref:Uncharacterized protein n=1 Tax=Pyrolobus fumarii (strain DSM 11204 / 1A) TaxID=694429 RepID=G0EG50_PYRF1|nr:hypothetical protein [Pyrolobus fumarii]AEM38298.1 hypothetical protein Pyrfu_0427 [Pyrolobus fumarii 1A]